MIKGLTFGAAAAAVLICAEGAAAESLEQAVQQAAASLSDKRTFKPGDSIAIVASGPDGPVAHLVTYTQSGSWAVIIPLWDGAPTTATPSCAARGLATTFGDAVPPFDIFGDFFKSAYCMIDTKTREVQADQVHLSGTGDIERFAVFTNGKCDEIRPDDNQTKDPIGC